MELISKLPFQIVGRKGPAKERAPLLILFSNGAMQTMLTAAELAASQPLSEMNYSFLKRLTEVLVGMGNQFCALYGKEPDVVKPDTFATYLQAFLALTRHPSLNINQTATSLWCALFRHDHLNTQPELLGVIESWIAVVARKTVRSPACAFDQMDFDSNEEFTAFHQKLRTELLDAVRLSTVLAPAVTFCYAQQWLFSQLDSPGAPVLSEWEALALFLDAVCSRCKEAPAGPQLLERCLSFQTTDPAILSEHLSCISALFVFVPHNPERLLQPVLNKIFSAVIFNIAGQTKDTRTKIVRNVRRHACSLLVKICLQHSALLAQHFEFLKNNVERLSQTQDDSKLSRMEVVALQESLLIISNQFSSFQMQSDFIGQVIRPAAEQWATMSPAFNSAQEFLSFIGLDRPPADPLVEDSYGQNRSELIACTFVFMAVLKRCRTSTELFKGHPAAQHMASLLFQTFRLARVLHQLWEPEAKKFLSPFYAKAHDVLDSERASILAQGGISQLGTQASTQEQKKQTPMERVQNFLVQIHANVFVILGSFGETLGEQFYAQPGLAVAMAGTACCGMEHLPDYRLRSIVRMFCRPFILACPAQFHQSVLFPFLAHLFPAMLQRLTECWQLTMQQQRERSPSEEHQADSQEILRDVVVRLLTRDYLDVLKVVLLSISNQTDENDEMMDPDAPVSTALPIASVSELGKAVLSEPSLCSNVLQCLLCGLWWPDTHNSSRASRIVESIVKYWASLLPRNSSHFPNSEVATLCLTHLLNGLQLLGQHEANLATLVHLGVLMYDTFLPVYPAVISEFMMRNAGCSREDTDQYQNKAASLASAGGHKQNQKLERSKRELFRKMTSQVSVKLFENAIKPNHFDVYLTLTDFRLLGKTCRIFSVDLWSCPAFRRWFG